MGAIRHEQRIDIPAEIRVAPASAFEKALLFRGRQVGRREKYFLNLFPVIRHGLASEVHLSPRVMRKTGADFLVVSETCVEEKTANACNFQKRD
jgi:hypothetical protein